MNIGQIVPQIFYDLIARIVPGLSLLGTLYLLWSFEIQTLGELLIPRGYDLSDLALSLYVLLLAYVLSMLLEGLWRLLCARWFSGLFDEPGARKAREGAIDDFALLDRGFCPFDYRFPGIPVIYDIIRLIEPNAGARLVKLRAELQLCRTLALGWSILFIATLLDFPFGGSGDARAVVIWALPVAVAAALAEYKSLQVRTWWAFYNHWLLLVSPGMGALAEAKMRAQNRLAWNSGSGQDQ